MRKLYWYLSSYIRKHGLIVFLTILIGSVIFSFIVPLIARSLEHKKWSYIGLVGEYSLTSLPAEVENLLSYGLTQVQEDGTPVPELAERWIIEDNGKSYRFVLKKNLHWQDGKPLVPEDVQYHFSDVETITTPNDVIFKLPEVFVPFPTVVARPIFRTDYQRYFLFFRRPTLIGLGTYQLVDYTEKGHRLTQIIIDGPEERRIYRFYLTEEDAILAYKRGEVDILPALSSPADIGAWPNSTSTATLNQAQYLAVFFNMDDPLFTKNVRQALSYSVEKPQDNRRANGPINPLSWAYLDGVKLYDFDLNRAVERLLDELPASPLNLELTTTPLYETDANTLKQAWEKLGQEAWTACQTKTEVKNKAECDRVKIAVAIRINSFPDTSNFQMLLVGQEAPSDPDQYALWHSGESTNFSRYRNTRIDSLLERGRQTTDRNERLAIYQEFQQFFLEDAPAVFLRHLETYQVTRK